MSLESLGTKKAGRVDGLGLRLVEGSAGVPAAVAPPDRWAYQAACVEAFVASQVARGFSPITIENGSGVLERFLAACGKPAWEVTADDVDRVVGELAAAGMAASTRRLYVQGFKGFHALLTARRAVEIQAWFGVALSDPIDAFNARPPRGR